MLPVSAFAFSDDGEAIISPFYLQIDSLFSSLSIDSAGKASCSGRVTATNTSTDLMVEVSLQQYKNNAWTTLATWTDSGPGSAPLSVTGSRYVLSGYTYRVVSTAKVYDKSGKLLETASKTTTEKTY